LGFQGADRQASGGTRWETTTSSATERRWPVRRSGRRPRRTAGPSGGSAAPVESRIKFLGHAVHQQLIPFPFGLFATAVIFDVFHLILESGELATVAYRMIVAGVVGGLVAAPSGLIDWTGIPKGTRTKKWVVLVLFVASCAV
jgi:hypothetical protein